MVNTFLANSGIYFRVYTYMKHAKAIVTALEPNEAYTKIMDICLVSGRAGEWAGICICYYLLYYCCRRSCCCCCCVAFWYLSKTEFVIRLLYVTYPCTYCVSTWKRRTNRQIRVGWLVCVYMCINKHQIIHFLLAVTHLAHLVFSLPWHSHLPRCFWFCILISFFYVVFILFFFSILYFSFFYFYCYFILYLFPSRSVLLCVRAWMNQWMNE